VNLEGLSLILRNTSDAFTSGVFCISGSARKGPEESRFLLRPVRLGTVTLRSTLLVVTVFESRRLA
jgi:hypothetical protein